MIVRCLGRYPATTSRASASTQWYADNRPTPSTDINAKVRFPISDDELIRLQAGAASTQHRVGQLCCLSCKETKNDDETLQTNDMNYVRSRLVIERRNGISRDHLSWKLYSPVGRISDAQLPFHDEHGKRSITQASNIDRSQRFLALPAR